MNKVKGGGLRPRLNALVPKKTSSFVQDYLTEGKFDNLGLLYHKFAHYGRKKEKDEKENFFFWSTGRGKEVFDFLNFFQEKQNFYNQVKKQIEAGFQELKHLYELRGPERLSISWRLVIGLGGASVYETSFTFHHLYGVPWILGSAFKGVVRSYLITSLFEASEEKALRNPVFREIFGSPPKEGAYPAQQGKVFFFDAYPEEFSKSKLGYDIMNCHFPEYYAGKGYPVDFAQPNPVPFLVVENTGFCFWWGTLRTERAILKTELGGKDISGWILEALKEHGLGAKTSLGYGLFE
ncbi:MAG: type III-B CRISPR module RAMP protein Cmr6 [Armatimonadetes bacterium]|nr:type III-B CRISPR module RAMP protein Cmr6 [Armatimonadota bacterium]